MDTIEKNTVASATPSGDAVPVYLTSLVIYGRLSIGFIGRVSDADFIAACGRILTAMTGNAHFPSPKPSLATIGGARDAFVAAVAALDRSSASIVVRDKARQVLERLLRALALYVQQVAQGDRELLLGSGFPLQRSRQPAAKPGVPHDLRVKQGDSGSILARCESVARAKSYQWRFAPSQTPNVWTQSEPTTRARYTFEGLVPGTQYTVQVRAVGTRGASDWSDAVVMFVN